MARYAKGTRSRAICDRCGFEIAYLTLRTEWTGLRVCEQCFDAKHPQLEPRLAVDAQELYSPRPGQNTREDARVLIVSGVTVVED